MMTAPDMDSVMDITADEVRERLRRAPKFTGTRQRDWSAETILLARAILQDDCIVWTGSATRKGHGQVWLKGKMLRTHRIAYEIWRGPILNDLHVLHTCDVPNCINPEHLFLGTNADNVADMVAKGRHRGHPRCILTENDVIDIRASSERTGVLAKRYGMVPSSIRGVRNGRKWPHVKFKRA
jgi:hypothetical protein